VDLVAPVYQGIVDLVAFLDGLVCLVIQGILEVVSVVIQVSPALVVGLVSVDIRDIPVLA